MARIEKIGKSSAFIHDLLPPSLSMTLSDVQYLFDEHPDERLKLKIGGEVIEAPRWAQAFGRSYHFTGMNHKAESLNEDLQDYLDYFNRIILDEIEHVDYRFNSALVNYYQNGHDYIGPHSDDTRQLHPKSPIVTVSFGATRKFRIRDKNTNKIVRDFDISHNEYFVMCSSFQDEFKHEIVKVNGEKGAKIGPRVSLTIRAFR